MKQHRTLKQGSANELSSQIKGIYDQAAKLKQKYLMQENHKIQNEVSTFVPFHNFIHQIPLKKDQQIVQKRLIQLNRLRLSSGGNSNNFQRTNKSTRAIIENHILNQMRNNDQNITRYATMGNFLNLQLNKKQILNRENLSKPLTSLKSLKKGNQRYLSAKNFVLKDKQDRVIETTNTKNNIDQVDKNYKRPKSKVTKLISFLKNSQTKPQQLKVKKGLEKNKIIEDLHKEKIDMVVQEEKKIVTPWSVLLKKTNPQIIAEIQELQQIQNQREFTPIGSARHSRTNSRSESRTSFTISTKKQSSYLSSRLLLCNTKKDNSPKKYLRKGARIRQALLKQLMDPNDPYHNDNNQMAYLRQYDQWMPSALVQNKRQQLQQFLGVFLGVKKDERRSDFQLQKMELVYL